MQGICPKAKRAGIESNSLILDPLFDGAPGSWRDILTNTDVSDVIRAINKHEEINLEGMVLDGDQASHLSQALNDSSCLPTKLNLRNVGSSNMTIIFEALEGKSGLTELNMDGFHKIEPSGKRHLMQKRHLQSVIKLLQHNVLNKLDLRHQKSRCWQDETLFSEFLTVIWKNENIRVLHLDHCDLAAEIHFSDGSLELVAPGDASCSNSSRLTELTLFGNEITLVDARNFIYEMGPTFDMRSLENISIDIFYGMETESAKIIMKRLEKFFKMKEAVQTLRSVIPCEPTSLLMIIRKATESTELKSMLLKLLQMSPEESFSDEMPLQELFSEELRTMKSCIQEINNIPEELFALIGRFSVRAMLNPALRC
jgi:hypothetical protein